MSETMKLLVLALITFSIIGCIGMYGTYRLNQTAASMAVITAA
jgi:uncharacterized membrane protein YqjE